jgi:hypothetical protein
VRKGGKSTGKIAIFSYQNFKEGQYNYL